MADVSYKIDIDVLERLDQYVKSLGGMYNRSEVISTAINLLSEKEMVFEVGQKKNSTECRTAIFEFHHNMTRDNRTIRAIKLIAEGVTIEIPKETYMKFLPPHILQFEPSKAVKFQVRLFHDSEIEQTKGICIINV